MIIFDIHTVSYAKLPIRNILTAVMVWGCITVRAPIVFMNPMDRSSIMSISKDKVDQMLKHGRVTFNFNLPSDMSYPSSLWNITLSISQMIALVVFNSNFRLSHDVLVVMVVKHPCPLGCPNIPE